jgi:hypothetical protein
VVAGEGLDALQSSPFVRSSVAPLLILSGTGLSYVAGWTIGSRPLVPALNTLAAFPFLYLALRQGLVRRAIAFMLVWAAAMAVCATLLSYAAPFRAGRLFVNGAAYRHEMFAWVATGVGAESSPRLFLPSHAVHAALFTALSLLSGSLLSMPMGAILINYMGHFVGALAAQSAHPVLTGCLAWVPWSVIRILSYVLLGVVLAGPVLSRLGRFPFDLGAQARWLVLAGCGLLADVGLKAMLAPWWQRILKAVVGW